MSPSPELRGSRRDRPREDRDAPAGPGAAGCERGPPWGSRWAASGSRARGSSTSRRSSRSSRGDCGGAARPGRRAAGGRRPGAPQREDSTSSPSTVSGRGEGERGAIGLPPLPLLLWWVYWGRGEAGGGSGAATSRGMLAPAATSRGMLPFGGASTLLRGSWGSGLPASHSGSEGSPPGIGTCGLRSLSPRRFRALVLFTKVKVTCALSDRLPRRL